MYMLLIIVVYCVTTFLLFLFIYSSSWREAALQIKVYTLLLVLT